MGFEPTVRLRARRFSRPVYSTTLAPLQGSMVCNRTDCRDNKCQGFGQEEPVRLTRAYALLPPNDAGLRTRFCAGSFGGLGASRARSRSLVGHRHEAARKRKLGSMRSSCALAEPSSKKALNYRPKGGCEALPNLSRRLLAQARSLAGLFHRVYEDHRRKTDGRLARR